MKRKLYELQFQPDTYQPYQSLGSPGKANDLLEYEFSVDQMNDQITGKVSFQAGRDNLLAGFKTNTT